jgi:hypothetical protein
VLAGASVAIILLARPSPLAVVAVSPADGAADVDRRAQVIVTFSRPVDPVATERVMAISPPVTGYASVGGRRAAFTPHPSLRGGSGYTVTIAGARDLSGRGLERPVVTTFRTRPLTLVVRLEAGGLARVPVGGSPTSVVSDPVGEFAPAAGALAYVRRRDGILVIDRAGRRMEVSIPSGLEARDLEWSSSGRALFFLATGVGEAGLAHVVRVEETSTPVALSPARPSLGGPLITEALKRSLVEVVYGHDSYAVVGDSAIVRDRNWDFALVDPSGTPRVALGPFLAVGNASPRGDALAIVDVDPADPALHRQIVVYGRGGALRHVSMSDRDSQSPRLAHGADRLVYATGRAAGVPRERVYALEIFDLTSGARRLLTTPRPGETDEAPRWSPDDAWIVFRRGPVAAPAERRAWLVPSEGGVAAPVLLDAIDARWDP